MIRAKLGGEPPLFVIGLSDMNVNQLRAGKPIMFNLSEIGIEEPGHVLVIWGKTEPDITRELNAPPEVQREAERVWMEGEARRRAREQKP